MAKKYDHDNSRDIQNKNFLMLYTTLVLILLTFFILLTTMVNFDDTKLGEVRGSIAGSFGIFEGGQVLDGDVSGGQYDKLYFGSPQISKIRSLLAPLTQEGEAFFTYRHNKIRISLQANRVFEVDSGNILSDIEPLLLELNQIAKELDVPLLIESHTNDRLPKTENMLDNWQLSTIRASAMLQFFLTSGTLKNELLSTHAYAANRSVLLNTSPEARNRNARIDFIFDLSGDEGEAAVKRLRQGQDKFIIEGFEFIIQKPDTLLN